MRLLILLAVAVVLSISAAAQDADTTFVDDLGVQYTVERYLVANYPVALAFTPDGRLFYTEKTTGSVRVVSADGELQREPVITLPTSAVAERGMLGIVIDPGYEDNGFIWIAHTAEATARDFPALNVVRFHEADGIGSDPQVMFSIPLENNALIHHGGNMRFDDEGRLFLSVGNMENPANSQDVTTPQGSILRFDVTDDGLIPAEGNPIDDNPMFAFGFRNPWDFDIDPYTDNLTRIFATENGDTCDDEINMVLMGFHYGQGVNYTCGGTAESVDRMYYQSPMISFTPTQAPTGIVVYDHEAVPAWQGEVFFCAWNNGLLRRITLNERRNQIESVHEMDLGDVQCRIDITVGPEGGLYFTTVGADGGAIYRVLPR